MTTSDRQNIGCVYHDVRLGTIDIILGHAEEERCSIMEIEVATGNVRHVVIDWNWYEKNVRGNRVRLL